MKYAVRHKAQKKTAIALLFGAVAAFTSPHVTAQAVPEIVAPGVISTAAREFATTLSPDGGTLYFNRASDDGVWRIWASRKTSEGWQEARPLDFASDIYSDLDPFVSRSGDRLYFSSDRPLPYAESTAPTPDNNTWYVSRIGEGWSAPTYAGSVINEAASETFFSESDNGYAVFTRFGEGSGRSRAAKLMIARRSAGIFDEISQIPVLPLGLRVSNPAIAPSGNLIVVAGSTNGARPKLYYTVKNAEGVWSAFMAFDETINGSDYVSFAPYISNDGKTLYFSSSRQNPSGGGDDIYRVSMPDELAEIAAIKTQYGPQNGSLIIVGGGGTAGTQILEKFVELGGGAEDGRFIVVPTAGGNFNADGSVRVFNEDDVLASWRAMGLKNVAMLHTHDKAVADTDAFAATVKGATAVWFNGGRQWNIVDSYAGTKTYDAFHGVLARGGVVAGSSAGASIQGEYLVRGDTKGSDIVMTEEVNHQRGFEFLRRSAIDQHINTRVRWDHIVPLIEERPDLLGIGLSERTAIIVTGDRFEVMGAWKVAVHDNTRPYQPWEKPYLVLQAGDVFNMRTRRVEAYGIGRQLAPLTLMDY